MCTANDPRVENLNVELHNAIFDGVAYGILANRYVKAQNLSDVLSLAISPILVLFLVTFARDTGPNAPQWVKPTWQILLLSSSVAAFSGTLVTWFSRALDWKHKRYISLRIRKGAHDIVDELKRLRANILKTSQADEQTQLFNEAQEKIKELRNLENEARNDDVMLAPWMEFIARQTAMSQVLNMECVDCKKLWNEGNAFTCNKRQAKTISKRGRYKGKNYCKKCGSESTMPAAAGTKRSKN